jgi:uncharacterized protein (TIGR03382 family)
VKHNIRFEWLRKIPPCYDVIIIAPVVAVMASLLRRRRREKCRETDSRSTRH